MGVMVQTTVVMKMMDLVETNSQTIGLLRLAGMVKLAG
jgi:hypothetical protein